jgi:sigma-B regulation protein RsbU (phosphoserine phosphatase)
MTSAVGKEIHAFMGGAEQSDDLTMLAIRYNGQARHSDSITLRNDVRQVTELNGFVKSVTGRLGMSKDRADKLRLAVEEIAVNVMKYAYPEGSEGLLDVSARSDGSRLAFVVTDSGEPFDPTSVPPADTDQPAAKRSPGGLGILLARSIADSIGYERKDGKNILTIGMDIK